MGKKKADASRSLEAYQKLYEAVKTQGNNEVAKILKDSLEEWRELQELLGKKEPSIKEINKKWKDLQKSSTQTLLSLASLFTAMGATSSIVEKNPKKAASSSSSTSSDSDSSSSSSDSSSDPDSDSDSDSDSKSSSETDSDGIEPKKSEEGPQTPKGSSKTLPKSSACKNETTKSNVQLKTGSKSDLSSSSSNSDSESDSDSDSDSEPASESNSSNSNTEPKKAIPGTKEAKKKPATSTSSPSLSSASSSSSSSSSESEGDSSDSSAETTLDSVSEDDGPPMKKRKTDLKDSKIDKKKPSNHKGESEKEEKIDKKAIERGAAETHIGITSNTTPSPPLAQGTPNSNMDGKGQKRPRKSNTPFQRIKVDSVAFADERLKDNSFYSRGARAGDYGERATADLIVTRGDSFRKEKNKKKRGSYRGGEITMESHSIKFT